MPGNWHSCNPEDLRNGKVELQRACSVLNLQACNSVSLTIDKETEHKELLFCESLKMKLGQIEIFSSFEYKKKFTGGWQSAGKHYAKTSK